MEVQKFRLKKLFNILEMLRKTTVKVTFEGQLTGQIPKEIIKSAILCLEIGV